MLSSVVTKLTLPVPSNDTSGASTSPEILKFLEVVNESAVATVAVLKLIFVLDAAVNLPLLSTVNVGTCVPEP